MISEGKWKARTNRTGQSKRFMFIDSNNPTETNRPELLESSTFALP